MPSRYETLCVVGLGYIGLPTAAAFAARKIRVLGVDVNERAVQTINQGRIHIVEPELDMLVHAAVTEGYLRAATAPEPADAFLIAVPTPFKDGHEPDLGYIQAAARSIAPVLKQGNLVILESTSPVGATEKLAAWLAAARPDLSFPQDQGERSDIRVAHCPERVLPGQVLRELVENDRVIGGMTAKCSEAAAELYRIFVKGECVLTSTRTAEMCKLTENAFRDVNIAFANELSLICDKLGIDVWELVNLANRHPRVNILQPGPGVGGHCIAVDPWFIVHGAPDQAKLIQSARRVNDGKPEWVIGKVRDAVAECVRQGWRKSEKEVVICCLGLAFKANIDDLRESPSLDIALRLAQQHGGEVLAVEPNVAAPPVVLQERRIPLVGLEEGVARADVLVVLVDHRPFREYPPKLLSGKIIVDTKGIWRSNR